MNNKSGFYFRAVRNNIRTSPLAFITLVLAATIAFTAEAWVLRATRPLMPPSPEDEPDYTALYLTLIIVGVYLIYCLFMYGYYLRITDERNLPYRRMGASRFVLWLESLFELILIAFIGSAIGACIDSIISSAAPQPEVLRYLDAKLFFETLGIISAAPFSILVVRSVVHAVKRGM